MRETFILVIGYNATFKFSLDKQLKIVYFLMILVTTINFQSSLSICNIE